MIYIALKTCYNTLKAILKSNKIAVLISTTNGHFLQGTGQVFGISSLENHPDLYLILADNESVEPDKIYGKKQVSW